MPYICTMCEKPEASCLCGRFCILCKSDENVRLCMDGCYYCEVCRDACDFSVDDSTE